MAKMYRWRLLSGVHSEGVKMYGPGQKDGDVITTTKHLGKMWNSPGSIRVQKIDEDDDGAAAQDTVEAGAGADDEVDDGDAALAPDSPVTKETLGQLSKAALAAFAKEKEISIPSKAKTKDAMIEAILFALA